MAAFELDFVCALKDIKPNEKKCFQLSSTGRNVMLVNSDNKIFCLDQACYHHGGPLVHGDIEEMGGTKTIKCPWHAYQISLEKGEGLYLGLNILPIEGGQVKKTQVLKSKGIKQRTHPVHIRDGKVYVQDSSKFSNAVPMESDVYAYKDMTIPEMKGSVRIHSGIN